jgi:DNA-binding FadR family transcriptional regulator
MPAESQANAFQPIKVGRASSAIVEQIRSMMLDGGLREGQRLPSERELAERFGVSRVTVRDALRALEAVGLVQIRVGARGGAFVTAPSGSNVGQTIADMLIMAAVTPDDIAETRLIVEIGTVTLACTRATEEDLETLREIVRRSREELRAGTYGPHLSFEFHSQLAKATHNGAIEGITASFRGTLSMHPVRVREPRKRSHSQTVKEHEAILAAVERSDAAEARALMAKHLLRGTGLAKRAESLVESWNERKPRAQRASTRRAK